MAGTNQVGSRRYASWSLRGWMAIKLARLDVEEHVVALKGGGKTTEIHALSPNKLVPYLQHDGARVWESLSICEYCADIEPSLWPQERVARAHARSISAQMHAGFRALRQACPMDVERVPAPLAEISDELAADVAFLNSTLLEALTRSGVVTPYLFGAEPTIADCMYAPVALRIHEYALDVDPVVQGWVETMLAHPLVREWCVAAEAEPAGWRFSYTDK